ncbi:7091_t:CDS:2 [Ambispora gerdemannii]|uniref:7091_t:CDS:1 n=1 Tax=Ambispora gerdemannii TaxID=144530 RepID=A0A9N8VNJ5_9GLOM|nr:7091_t:CDS:2 [Ambispora gerdemannii]
MDAIDLIVPIVILLVTLLYRFIYKKTELSLGKLEGKNVIITGASWGIGAEIAYHCALNKASKIIIAARRTSLLEKVYDKCLHLSNNQSRIKVVTCDLGIEEECVRLIRESLDFFKSSNNDSRIDLLILNHTLSIMERINFSDPIGTLEKTRNLTNVNFIGFAALAHHAIPHMSTLSSSSSNFSTIIVVTSMFAEISLGMSWAYSATKSAINSYFNCLRDQLSHAKLPIRVTIVHLGAVNTEIWKINLSRFPKLWFGSKSFIAKDPSEAADVVLRSGLRGEKNVWFPWYTVFLRMIYGVIPEVARSIGRFIEDTLLEEINT